MDYQSSGTTDWDPYGGGDSNIFGEQEPLLPFDDLLDEPIPAVAEVEFLNLSEDKCFDKVQCRKGGKPKQILENAVIQMKATYGPEPLLKIRGWIRRDPDAAKLCNDYNQSVLLCESEGKEWNLAEKSNRPIHADDPRYMSQLFSVDLGKVYDGPSQPVFQLAKIETMARNRFQLLIQLEFLHRPPTEPFVSPTFVCRTKPKRRRTENTPSMEPPASRSRTESNTSDPHSDQHPGSPCNLIVDTLNAQTAIIKDLVAENVRIETERADIAYHMRIADPEMCAGLEEGDLVGFYTNPADGKTYIKPLNGGEIGDAVHAGVISRSYYIAGHKDYSVATDTVCVIGIVNVKVVGSIQNCERIYSSVDHPGKAIPQSHLPVGRTLRNKHFLLGMALERKHSKTLEDIQLVKCFVCIVLDVSRQETLDEVDRLYQETENSTKTYIKRAQSKAWLRLKICLASFLVFAALLSFFLYQVFVPGSMFRYWLCRQGSISGHDVNFDFVPLRESTSVYHAHGIQFLFSQLKDKISDHFTENKRSDTGGKAYYFLNLDRCAYYGDYGPVGNTVGGHKVIGGGKILSVNHNCSIVYWYGFITQTLKIGWKPYISTTHLVCDPRLLNTHEGTGGRKLR